MSSNAGHFLRNQLPAILWAVIIFIASSIPASMLPRFAHLINDKIVHGAIFFVLGLLIYRALEPKVKQSKFDWRRLFIAISSVVLYGLSDEFHQGFVSGRSLDIFDAAADSAGGILSAVVIYFNETRNKGTKS